ncbi:MAG TPA: hemolysin family protein [Clostridia bacterium]|nr:hemolysin family protein [Clostridia bacterium]
MVTFALLRVIAVFLLVAANAFFVAAEFALVSVRDTRIQQLIDARRIGARTVQKLHRHLDEVLNGVQFGITIASLALGWVGESAMAHLLEPLLARLPYAAVYSHAIGITIAFALITYLHVILGEVVPKSIALQKAERVALAVAAPMDVFMTISRPALVVMNASSRVVLKLFGTHEIREGGVHSPEELKMVVTASRRFGLIPLLQEEMIHRALDLENVTVREVMVPRPDIFSLPGDMTLDEALRLVVEEQHSRIPVYDPERGPEYIIGVLYSKDLMRWMQFRMAREASDELVRKPTTLRVRHIMRDALVVPETKDLPDLLLEFKKRKRHLAVVVDEFGTTAGVVTVEDVLEQLVGEIEDEFDVAPAALVPGATSMVLDGATNIRDLETQYHLKLPRDQGFETLAGFVLTQLQRIPKTGDSFEYEGRRYTVLEMDGNRVESVNIELLKPVANQQA